MLWAGKAGLVNAYSLSLLLFSLPTYPPSLPYSLQVITPFNSNIETVVDNVNTALGQLTDSVNGAFTQYNKYLNLGLQGLAYNTQTQINNVATGIVSNVK